LLAVDGSLGACSSDRCGIYCVLAWANGVDSSFVHCGNRRPHRVQAVRLSTEMRSPGRTGLAKTLERSSPGPLCMEFQRECATRRLGFHARRFVMRLVGRSLELSESLIVSFFRCGGSLFSMNGLESFFKGLGGRPCHDIPSLDATNIHRCNALVIVQLHFPRTV
jgi:hypothetical protein